MTDSTTVLAYVVSPDLVQTSFSPIHPRLQVSCNLESGKRVLNIAIWTGAPSDDDEIELRIDQESPFPSNTIRSENLEWQFLGNSRYETAFVRVVEGLYTAKKLTVQFTPYVQSSVVFSFPLAGGRAVLQRLQEAGCVIPYSPPK